MLHVFQLIVLQFAVLAPPVWEQGAHADGVGDQLGDLPLLVLREVEARVIGVRYQVARYYSERYLGTRY